MQNQKQRRDEEVDERIERTIKALENHGFQAKYVLDRNAAKDEILRCSDAVSYTRLTLPTNREV